MRTFPNESTITGELKLQLTDEESAALMRALWGVSSSEDQDFIKTMRASINYYLKNKELRW